VDNSERVVIQGALFAFLLIFGDTTSLKAEDHRSKSEASKVGLLFKTFVSSLEETVYVPGTPN